MMAPRAATRARRRAAAAAVAVVTVGGAPSWAGGADIAPLVVKPGVPIHFTGVGTETGENSCTTAFLTGPYQPRIAPMLPRAEEVLGIRLSLRTAPLVENAPAFGADPACAPLCPISPG